MTTYVRSKKKSELQTTFNGLCILVYKMQLKKPFNTSAEGAKPEREYLGVLPDIVS